MFSRVTQSAKKNASSTRTDSVNVLYKDKMKIAILIPTTSKGRSWKNIRETYLYTCSLKTFFITHNPEHDYVFYIGYDHDDPLFSIDAERNDLVRVEKAFPRIAIKFVALHVEKGHVTKMWNILFQMAFDEACDNNGAILTQAMFSRKHMEIFGFMFPEEIKNWCCDDWYNYLYRPNHFYPLQEHYCSNDGGAPRYVINNDPNFENDLSRKVTGLRRDVAQMAAEHRKKLPK
jgi:hypothetical protein